MLEKSKKLSLVIPQGLKEAIDASINLGGKELQVIRISVDEHTNMPYKILLHVIILDKKNPGKLGAEGTLTYGSGKNKREIQSILWSSVEMHDINDGGRVWQLELRPQMYILSQDKCCDIYTGSPTKVLSGLMQAMGIKCSVKSNKTADPEPIFARYNQTGLNFFNYIVAYSNLQYYFDKEFIIADKFQKSTEYTIDESIDNKSILNVHFKESATPGEIKARHWDRHKSLALKTDSIKISDSNFKSTHEENFFAPDARVVTKDWIPNGKVILIEILNYTHLSVGNTINLKYKNLSGKYYVVDAQHDIYLDEDTTGWVYKSILILSKQNNHIADYSYPVNNILHRGVVNGGKPGQIITNKFGQVQIRYLWQKSEVNIWAHVSMANIGVMHRGIISLPRVGDEVILMCIDGDLAQPVIAGSLSNIESIPDKDFTEHPTKTLIRTKSFSTEKKEYENQICFDDTADKEILNLTSAKDMTIIAGNDSKVTIHGKQEELIEKGRSISIKPKEKDPAHDSLIIENGNRTVKLNGSGTKDELTIKSGNIVQHIEKGNYDISSNDGNYKIAMKKGSMTHDIKDEYTLNAKSITIKCGPYSINVTQGGVKISATGDIELSGADIKLSGTNIKLSAKNAIELKGREVKINGIDVKINGTKQTDISGGKINLDAMATLSASGKAQLKLSSSGVSELSSSMTMIKGSAMLKLN